MTHDPTPNEPASHDDDKPALLPYDPPTVQSVKLTDEAAESLT